MDVEVLHIEDCPNWQEAGRRTEEALAATGHAGQPVRYRLLSTSNDAIETAFAGSPTITLDGTDLFPSDGRTNDLACRVYPTPTGLAGLPTVEQIIAALLRATHATA